MNLVHGTIVSFLLNGEKTKIIASVDLESGEIFPEVVEHTDISGVIREEFITDSGITYMVCDDCHEFIITQQMREDGSDTMCINCTDNQWY